MKMCHSCGMPLSEDTVSMNENFCKHCTDKAGNVKSHEEVKQGVAWWLRSWQKNIDEPESLKRAESYMNAMPYWAEKK